MAGIISSIYRALSFYNDVRAVSRGPDAIARRMVRKTLWRTAARGINATVKPRRSK